MSWYTATAEALTPRAGALQREATAMRSSAPQPEKALSQQWKTKHSQKEIDSLKKNATQLSTLLINLYQGIHDTHMNLLVMSNFIMGLKYCLLDLLNLKLYFFSLTPFFGSESLRLAHPGGGDEEVVLTCISGRMHYLYILFGVLHKNVYFLFTQSFIHSFIQPFISVGTHVYLCYIFSYNPIPLYFVAQIVPAFVGFVQLLSLV